VSLTYCTNIHPGERWDEVQAQVFANVPEVRRALAAGGAPVESFPLSLWLSGRAAREAEAQGSAAFLDFCRATGCAPASINGFPYGAFHGQRVKEEVYLPDWRDPERAAHTARLGCILGEWLQAAPGQTGVISTVPLGFKGQPGADWSEARRHLVSALESLDAVSQQTGRDLVLSLEAEPACLLETTAEVITFFEQLRLPPSLARHLGICFDCCHQAVQFEQPAESLKALLGAGVRLSQAHVTTALRVPGGALESLRQFDEPVYLHQTVGRRTDGALVRFADLPGALASGLDGGGIDEWRVHFHAPVFAEEVGGIRTTQPELRALLAALSPEVPLVVETYTFGVLPEALRLPTVAASIARELLWVRAQAGR
jgi:sugar phosphate isomerase/epimerase